MKSFHMQQCTFFGKSYTRLPLILKSFMGNPIKAFLCSACTGVSVTPWVRSKLLKANIHTHPLLWPVIAKLQQLCETRWHLKNKAENQEEHTPDCWFKALGKKISLSIYKRWLYRLFDPCNLICNAFSYQDPPWPTCTCSLWDGPFQLLPVAHRQQICYHCFFCSTHKRTESSFPQLSRFPSIQLNKKNSNPKKRTQPRPTGWEIRCNVCYCGNRRPTHRDVLEKMNWVVFNVICDEIVICYSQESHFWDGEDVHELFHLRSLSKTMQNIPMLGAKAFCKDL